MNYFLKSCLDFLQISPWYIPVGFCFFWFLLGYSFASFIRSLSRIKWGVLRCLRALRRLSIGFFPRF